MWNWFQKEKMIGLNENMSPLPLGEGNFSIQTQ